MAIQLNDFPGPIAPKNPFSLSPHVAGCVYVKFCGAVNAIFYNLSLRRLQTLKYERDFFLHFNFERNVAKKQFVPRSFTKFSFFRQIF